MVHAYIRKITRNCVRSISTLLDNRPLKMGPKSCPESSARNYHYSLRNNTEERSSHSHSRLLYKFWPAWSRNKRPDV